MILKRVKTAQTHYLQSRTTYLQEIIVVFIFYIPTHITTNKPKTMPL